MHQLGKLLYIVERNRKISAAVASQSSQRTYSLQTNQTPSLGGVQPDPPGLPRSAPGAPQDLSIDIVTQRPALRASGQSVSRGFPPPYPSRYSPQGSRVGPQAGLKQTVSKGANALQRVSHSFGQAMKRKDYFATHDTSFSLATSTLCTWFLVFCESCLGL